MFPSYFCMSSAFHSSFYEFYHATFCCLPLTQSVRLLLPYHSLCSIDVIYGMPCHSSGHQILPKALQREIERIPRSIKYPKAIFIITYLSYLPPKEYYKIGSIYMINPIMEYYIRFLLGTTQNINS